MITPEQHKIKFENSFVKRKEDDIKYIITLVDSVFKNTAILEVPFKIYFDQNIKDLNLIGEAAEIVSRNLKQAGWDFRVIGYDKHRFWRLGYLRIGKYTGEF